MLLYLSGPDYGSPYSTGEFFNVIEEFGIFNILFLLLFFVMLINFLSAKEQLLYHWNVLIKGFSFSPQTFYKLLEEELIKEGIEGIKLSTKDLHEGGIISGRRQYATISWKEYSYSVCASPFASSFFVSYRSLGRENRFANAFACIPWLGKYFVRWFFPVSWYKEDTIMMFHSIVHESIVNVVNDISQKNGIPRLTDRQETSKAQDIFNR